MPTESVWLQTSDSVRLEGRLGIPDSPRGGAVLCHPHPQYGGSMSSVLVPILQRALVAAGWMTLRFNFRGVGRSGGAYGGGRAETLDVRAAADLVSERAPEGSLVVAGWSFGAIVGLDAAAADPRVRACAGIAPPVSTSTTFPLPLDLPDAITTWNAPVLLVCGTTDPFCTPKGLRTLAARFGTPPRVEVIEGEDHFFSHDPTALADLVVSFFSEV